MDELRDQFLLEARELARQAADELLALERDPEDAQAIDRVFRAVHTMKGGTGLFDLAPLGALLHAAEDLLDELRHRRLAAGQAMISALIGTIMQTERWLDAFEEDGGLPDNAAVLGRGLEAALRAAAGGDGPAPAAPEPAAALMEWAAGGTESAAGAARMLRVPAARLDQLAQIVDELMLAKAELAHLIGQLGEAGMEAGVPRRLLSGQATLDRLGARLHRAVAELRLVPLSLLVRRFPALARDIADQLGKRVELVVAGEMFEVDKSIVDGLFEPLLHLVRNAVDHGIEPPERRAAAGKAPGATITLAARRHGDRFVLTLADDGAGIDPARLREAARGRLGMGEAELAALSRRDMLDLIFRPGFSTAAAVGAVSGRGVGMDAVRAAVAAMGGKVAVDSIVGAGTTVSLTLPLRIVMSRVVTVQAGGERFGVPVEAIVETVRVTPRQIQPVRHGRAFIWRDRVVPLFELAALLGAASGGEAADGCQAMVIGAGDRLAAIAVDRFSSRMDVSIRPPEGVLAGIRGISGTALAGDGHVLLILNPDELVA